MQVINNASVRGQVACVTSMWEGTYQKQTRTLLTIQRCTPQNMVHPVYGMRVIEKAGPESLIPIEVGPSMAHFIRGTLADWPDSPLCTQDIQCVLNVQHNCWDAQCPVSLTKSHTVERTLVNHNRPEVANKELNSYIINAAALYSAEYHRQASGLEWGAVSRAEWEAAVGEGLKRWLTSHPVPEAGPLGAAGGS